MIVVYLLGEGAGYGVQATPQDAVTWANTHNLTFPVLADPGWVEASKFEADGYIPSQSLIGTGLEILKVDAQWISAGEFESALPAAEE